MYTQHQQGSALKQVIKVLPVTLFCLTFSSISYANDSTDKKTMSPEREEGFSADIGLSLSSSPYYKGAKDGSVNLFLDGAFYWHKNDSILYWESFDINDTGIGWRYLKRSDWQIDTSIRHETVLPKSHTENAGIDNFPHRGSHIFTSVESKHSLNNNWIDWASAKLSFGPSNYGWLSEAAIGHTVKHTGLFNSHSKASTSIRIFTSFASAEHLDNYFGISESDSSSSGLSSIHYKSGYRSTGLEASHTQNIRSNIKLLATIGVENYASKVKESELVSQGLESKFDLSVFWLF